MKPLEHHLREQLELPDGYFWHATRWRAVRRFLPAGPITVLDVGAGGGWLGHRLAEERPDVSYTFVEPLSTLSTVLEEEFGPAANARTGSPITAQAVTMLDVMEHQSDDIGFLSDYVRRSVAGTTFVLTVPASMRLWSAWDVELGHFRRYTARSLRATMRSAGLEITEVSYLFPELWPAAAARRLAAPAKAADPGSGRPEFRALPRPVNGVLRGVGAGTVAVRRLVPFGTSVLGVGRTPVSETDTDL
ncbi:MAG: methyltransferase domain-containing protein [Actinomycetota bacterium]